MCYSMNKTSKMSKNPVHKCFFYDPMTKISVCKHCKIEMKGKHTENLTRHIKRKHADISEEIFADISAKKKLKDSNENSILKYIVKSTSTATVNVSKEDLLNGCVELVTKNGRSLRMLEDSGFRKIIDPLCKAVGISINRQNIKEQVVNRALRSAMTSTFKHRFLSIKVDCVSRLDRSIIGIKAQYIETVRSTLNAVHILTDSQGCSTDNEAEDGANDEEFVCDYIPNDINEELEQDLLPHDAINVIRCAAHTLNLAVSDFLKEISEVRSKARTIVKKLRTPTLLNLLRSKNLNKPVIECATRWGSTYNMIKSLLALKTFCLESSTDIKELYTNENDWHKIEIVCEILNPAYDISIKLQRKNLVLSDMFLAWYSCKMKVEKKNGWLNLKFITALKKRGLFLLNNSCVLAAVYLDPRYQILLSESQKHLAKKHLIKVYELKSKMHITVTTTDSPQSKISSDDELESILELLDRKETLPNKKTIVDIISCFDNVKRLSQHTDVLQYWHNHSENKLKSIAEIVLAAPATQVSVEICTCALLVL